MTASTTQRRFRLGGIEVLLTWSRGTPSLEGNYDAYPSRQDDADLIIDFSVDPSVGTEPGNDPDYPAFRRSTRGHEIILERFDAEGVLEVPSNPAHPITGHFRVGTSSHSVDAAIRAGLSITFPRKGGLILHASAIAHQGSAFAFSGQSGAGKSTIVSLLGRALPGAIPIADDLLAVTPGRPAWLAHVVPFLGTDGLPHQTTYPLSALHFLVQANAHRCTPLTRQEGLRHLLRHVLAHVAESRTANAVLAAAADLVDKVPVHTLEFRNEIDVVRVLRIT